MNRPKKFQNMERVPTEDNKSHQSSIDDLDEYFIVGGARNYGFTSKKMTCPNCRNFIRTKLKFSYSWNFFVLTVLLTFVGLCFMPFVFNWGKKGKHKCPICKCFLGIAIKLPEPEQEVTT